MRIYKVDIEHKRYGINWKSVKVFARTCEEAIRKAKSEMNAQERVESVELLATAEL